LKEHIYIAAIGSALGKEIVSLPARLAGYALSQPQVYMEQRIRTPLPTPLGRELTNYGRDIHSETGDFTIVMLLTRQSK
jgi:hypothetical protein